MRITRLEVHRVNVPLVAGYRWASGVYFGATKGIVEIHTDEGLIGLGEVATVENADVVEHELAPRLIGGDPLCIDDCERRCLPEIRTLHNTHDVGLVRAFGGIEMALWDLKGKALGVPVYALWGGPVRREIGFSEYFALRVPGGEEPGEATPLEVARYCARMREAHGSMLFEGKVGVLDLDVEIAMVREVRAAIGPDATLRLDANYAWPLNTARKALARTRKVRHRQHRGSGRDLFRHGRTPPAQPDPVLEPSARSAAGCRVGRARHLRVERDGAGWPA